MVELSRFDIMSDGLLLKKHFNFNLTDLCSTPGFRTTWSFLFFLLLLAHIKMKLFSNK